MKELPIGSIIPFGGYDWRILDIQNHTALVDVYKRQVLDAGVQAAWAGAGHTKDLVATKGRASYVGERGLGHQDPGATSYSYMLEVVAGLM